MKHDAVMLMGRIHDLTQKWLRGELAAAGLSGIVPSHGDVLALLFMKGEATMQSSSTSWRRRGLSVGHSRRTMRVAWLSR